MLSHIIMYFVSVTKPSKAIHLKLHLKQTFTKQKCDNIAALGHDVGTKSQHALQHGLSLKKI